MENKEESLVEMLLTIEGIPPGKELWKLFFELFEDYASNYYRYQSPPQQSDSIQKVKSFNFFKVFFNLFVKCVPEIQIYVLSRLEETIQNNFFIEQYLIDHEWTTHFLLNQSRIQDDTILGALFVVIETLATYHISPRQIKLIFQLFQSQQQNFKEYYWINLFHFLQKIWKQSSGPNAFFHFTGQNSAIVLPSSIKIPNSYTIMIWFNAETFGSEAETSAGYTPYLYCFSSDKDTGFSCCFQRNKLTLYVNQKKDSLHSETTNYLFTPKKWYFLVLTHSYNFLRRSDCTLYVNGESVQTFPLPYPRTDKAISKGYIGSSLRLDNPKHFFRGEIGGFAFLEDIVPSAEIADLYRKGPNVFCSFECFDQTILQPKSGFILFKSRLKLLAFYSPLAVDNTWCVDPSDIYNDARRALKLPGVQQCRVSHIQQTLPCVGGIQALLPFFVPEYRPSIAEIKDLNLQIFALITELIKSDSHYLNELYERRFFVLLGHLLSEPRFAQSNKWSHEAITILETLSQSIYSCEGLFKHFFQHIYLNFRIWKTTDFDVQQALLQSIWRHINNDTKNFHTLVGVHTFVNILSEYYSLSVDGLESYHSGNNNNTNRQLMVEDDEKRRLQRMTRLQLQPLRHLLLQIIQKLMTKNAVTSKAITSLIFYLQQELKKPPEFRMLDDVLKMLLLCLDESMHREVFFKKLEELGGCSLFLPLLQTESESERVWTLKILGKIMSYCCNSSSKYKQTQMTRDIIVMKKYMEAFSFTTPIYLTLLEILLDCISIKDLESPIIRTDQSSQLEQQQQQQQQVKSSSNRSLLRSSNTFVQERSRRLTIKSPHIIPIIFELLCLRGDIKLKHRVVNDFIQLLNVSAENKVIFLKQQNWQSWLLALLVDSKYSERDTAILLSLIVNLMTMLFQHCIWQHDGHKVFETSKAVIHHFLPMSGTHIIELCRKVNIQLLQTLQSTENFVSQCRSNSTVCYNMLHWLFFTETFLFSNPKAVASRSQQPQQTQTLSTSQDITESSHYKSLLPLEVFRSEDGLWMDFNLAQKLLSFLDVLTNLNPTSKSETSKMMSISNIFTASFAGFPLTSNTNQQNKDIQSALPPAIVTELEQHAQRFYLNLVLHSIKENGAFRMKRKIESRRTTLGSIKQLVDDIFSSQRAQQSLLSYLQEKTKQFTLELSDFDQLFNKNIQRLRFIVNHFLISQYQQIATPSNTEQSGTTATTSSPNISRNVLTNSKNTVINSDSDPNGSVPKTDDSNLKMLHKLLYLLSFIYYVAKQPESNENDIQSLLVSLFKDLSAVIKPLLAALHIEVRPGVQVNTLTDEELAYYFLNGFAMPDTFPLANLFSEGIVSVLKEEKLAIEKNIQVIENNKTRILQQMEQSTIEELETFRKADSEIKKSSERFCHEGEVRKRQNQIQESQQLAQIERYWKQQLRILTSERGPFALPSDPQTRKYWKLDSVQTSGGLRLRLKQHYGDLSLVLKASEENDRKLAERMRREQGLEPVNEEPSVRPNSEHQLLKVSCISKSTSNDLEDDWEEIPESLSSPISQPNDNETLEDSSSERKEIDIFYVKCEFVKGLTAIPGDFEVTKTQIVFRNLEKKIFKAIPYSQMQQIFSRRYNLRTTALEFFLRNKKSYFFNFESKKDVSTVMKKILARKPPLEYYFLGSPKQLFQKKEYRKFTEMWQRRQISNFDYLMILNTIAGRTMNDLAQYPVFPWILSDYVSKEIDLSDPRVYRDLTKPIGALEPKRLAFFLERMASFNDPEIPKFLYGSHYSSAGIVLFYLVRMEPYTTYYLQLMDGRFDLPARMFSSISETWKNCLIDPSDVKELIPEFFYQPAFLTNINGLNLGVKPNGESISNVVLPPWAHNDPYRFIEINRAALESEYVSERLHHWIDLIFGYKQQGPEAEKAQNVFYYLTYEGKVDIDKIEDPLMKKSILDQIRHFGQTPSQLLTTPHPKRLTLVELERATLIQSFKENEKSIIEETFKIHAHYFHPLHQSGTNSPPILYISNYHNKVLVLYKDTYLQKINFSLPAQKGKKIPLVFDASPQNKTNAKTFKKISDLFFSYELSREAKYQNLFGLTSDHSYLICAGQWDNSLLFIKINNLTTTRVFEHKNTVSCLAIEGNKLVTGSYDGLCFVWDLTEFLKTSKKEKLIPERVLFGHEDHLTCVALNLDLDLIVTASKDCTCILYSFIKGHYLRSLHFKAPVSLVAISKYGKIVSYSLSEQALYVHSINGELLYKEENVGKIHCLAIDKSGELLLTAGETGWISVRSLFLHTLKILFQWKCSPRVNSLTLIGEDYLACGLEDGRVFVMLFDANCFLETARKKL